MAHFDNLFLSANPRYKLLVDANEETRELLLWAEAKRYIAFIKTPSGSSCYTQDDLNKARMWKEKLGGISFDD